MRYHDEIQVCDCKRLNAREIKDAIKSQNLKTVEEVVEAIEAGGSCRSCVSPEEEAGRDVYIVDLLKEING